MADSEFSLSFPGLSSEQLKQALSDATAGTVGQGLSFQVRSAPIATRHIDPTVLVAVTNAVSAVLGVVITGLFQLAAKNRGTGAAQTAPAAPPVVVIVGNDGSRLELPVGTPQAEVDRAAELAAKVGVAHLYVSGH